MHKQFVKEKEKDNDNQQKVKTLTTQITTRDRNEIKDQENKKKYSNILL